MIGGGKIFSSCVGLTLLASLTAGCAGVSTPSSSPQTSTGKTPITWMTWGSTDPLVQISNELFKAYPDMKDKFDIQPQIGGQGDADVAQKFRLALAANGDVPDIIQLNRSELPEFAEAGVLEDLTSVIQPYQDKMMPGYVQLASYKGKMVDFPYQIKPKVWFYRKDMFDAAGIDPSKIKTLDDFIAAGKKLHDKFPNSYIEHIGAPIDGSDLGMLLSGNGGRFADDQGNYIVDTDPGVRKAFEALKQLKDSGVTADVTSFTPDFEKAISSGTVASWLIADWAKPFITQWAPDESGKWAVADWPVIADSVGGSEAGGGVWVIPAKAKHKKEAIDLLTKILLTKQGNLAVHTTRGVLPTLKETYQDPSMQQPDKYYGNVADVETRAVDAAKMYPFTPASITEITIVNTYLDKYVHGQLSLDAALKQANADLKNQIGNPYKK